MKPGATQALVNSDACPLSRDQLEELANDHGSTEPSPGNDEVVLMGRPAYGRAARAVYVPADVVLDALSEAYSEAMQPPERPLTRGELEQLAREHGSAQPTGKNEVQLVFRPAFGAEMMRVYVPVEAVNRAISEASHASATGDSTASMATTSAGVAMGSSERAMAFAVFSRSNTRPAARASSLSPLRSMLRSRSSKAKALVNLVMGSLSEVVVVEDPHRKTETGTHPYTYAAGPAVIFTAPQGSGKTRQAQQLADDLGCTKIIDEWGPTSPLQPGALHLTNCHPSYIAAHCAIDGVRVQMVSHGWLRGAA